MSLQLATGSLVALGVGVSDATAIISLGRRFGNWWSTKTEDADFLDLLDLDEMVIMTRGGLFDILDFNNRWGTTLHILANGKPERFPLAPDISEKLLGRLTKFTASMLCMIAVFDEFSASQMHAATVKAVMDKLLRMHEEGGDIVASQLSIRINAWRSAARARGLTSSCRQTRVSLIKSGVVQGFLIHHDECEEVAKFLFVSRRSAAYPPPD